MLAILRKSRLKDQEMRVLMLGLDNAGKTTIVKHVMGEDVNTVSPTLGFIIKTIDYKGYVQTPILLPWDVGGQKTLRSYWRNYFEKTDSLIWVVDATDRFRLGDCKVELHGLLQEERLLGASLLVFANKTDVSGCMSEAEITEGLDLNEIKTHKWTIYSCSAITGKNILEGLDWVVGDAQERLFLYNGLGGGSATANTAKGQLS
ncbi:ARF/SAR superfamily [Choiromyces venosus 120613-1]|uniref:Abnormal eversion of vulva protein 20 n=1 Tax=Choiromyces venosus 120613-1 TaxID=1336337 RepID=A0A3N4K6Z7_9PEZI|nr:ARF/SAR superfamily [Choiromyces venosus 120613-1]